MQHRLRLARAEDGRRRAARPGRQVRLRRDPQHPHAGHPELGPGRPQPAADRPVGHRAVRRAGHAAAGGHDRPPPSPTRARSCARTSSPRRSRPTSTSSTRPSRSSSRRPSRPEIASTLTGMLVSVVDNGTGTPAKIAGVARGRQDRHRPAGRGQGRRTRGSPPSRRPTTHRWPSRSSSRTAATPAARRRGQARRTHRQGRHGSGDQEMTPTSGTTLGGRYTLMDHVAAGGMGDVWTATDSVLGRAVAVKVLRPNPDPTFASALPRRGPSRRRPLAPEHLHRLRLRRRRRRGIPGHGVRAGAPAVRAHRRRADAARAGARSSWDRPRSPSRPPTRRASSTATSSRRTSW